MALTDEGGSGIPATMLVGPASVGAGMPYPVYQNGGGNNGFGGDNGWWIVLLIILLAAGNGFGNNNGGGGFISGGYNGTDNLYPWMNQANLTSEGFQNQLMNDNVTSIRDSISDISTQLCNGFGNVQQSLCSGFAGVNQTVSNGFAQAEIAENARQMANMQQMFGLSKQFSDCCCENRLATAQTQNILARESAETRFADANNTRDIIQSQTSGTQAILDKLCQLELDAKTDKIADLERQLTMANLAASQTAQTARLERSNNEVIDGLYNRLATCPVGTMPVYGNQPIFTCPNNNNSCGCGCGNNF